MFKDSSTNTPLIFVLSVGTDPAADLYKFAEEMRFTKKLNAISLGQGQVRMSIHICDGDKNVTDLHSERYVTVVLHGRISVFFISQPFSLDLRREMTCFAAL